MENQIILELLQVYIGTQQSMHCEQEVVIGDLSSKNKKYFFYDPMLSKGVAPLCNAIFPQHCSALILL